MERGWKVVGEQPNHRTAGKPVPLYYNSILSASYGFVHEMDVVLKAF
jgi:hypothetical protein